MLKAKFCQNNASKIICKFYTAYFIHCLISSLKTEIKVSRLQSELLMIFLATLVSGLFCNNTQESECTQSANYLGTF